MQPCKVTHTTQCVAQSENTREGKIIIQLEKQGTTSSRTVVRNLHLRGIEAQKLKSDLLSKLGLRSEINERNSTLVINENFLEEMAVFLESELDVAREDIAVCSEPVIIAEDKPEPKPYIDESDTSELRLSQEPVLELAKELREYTEKVQTVIVPRGSRREIPEDVADSYCDFRRAVIELEKKYEQKATSQNGLSGVNIEWRNVKAGVWTGLLRAGPGQSQKLKRGTKLKLLDRSGESKSPHEEPTKRSRYWHAEVVMVDEWKSEIKIQYTDHKLRYKKVDTFDDDCASACECNDEDFDETKPPNFVDIEIIFNSLPFDREIAAVEEISTMVKGGKLTPNRSALLSYLFTIDKGISEEQRKQFLSEIPLTKEKIPGIKEPLDDSQRAAVAQCLLEPLTLIQGPPGTGKTTTLTAVVYHYLSIYPNARILVCSHSNVSIDHLTRDIAAIEGINVVRYRSPQIGVADPKIAHINVSDMVYKQCPELMEMKMKLEAGELTHQEKTSYYNQYLEQCARILRGASVICCTSSMAGHDIVKGISFDMVIVDEATQSKETECLIPFIRAEHKVVLAGDHKQLGPTIRWPAAKQYEVDKSLFERLVDKWRKPITLGVQYRMSPPIAQFPSQNFYDGQITNGITIADRMEDPEAIEWPYKDAPLLMIDTDGKEKQDQFSMSWYNVDEERCIMQILRLMICVNRVDPSRIGVITPYLAQVERVKSAFMDPRNHDLQKYCTDIQIATVDSFQGSEKDYVIISCVRNNDNSDIGFLADERRLNVALTRAKYGLIIVGSVRTLRNQTSNSWGALVNDLLERGLVRKDIRKIRTSAQAIKDNQTRK